MMTAAPSPGAMRRRRVRRPVLAVTAIAWVATVLVHTGNAGRVGESMHSMDSMHGMSMDHMSMAAHDHTAPTSSSSWWLWSLMVVAMMAPMVIGALRHVMMHSLRRRRWRAVVLFLLAYLAIWEAAGGLLLPAAKGLNETDIAIPLALGATLLWQVSPAKQSFMNRHHLEPPLAAFGRRADLDAVRFGARHALWCVGSGWGLMLLPLVFESSHLAVMAVVSLWMWGEQFDKPVAPSWRIRVPVKAMRIVRRFVLPPAPLKAPAPAFAGA